MQFVCNERAVSFSSFPLRTLAMFHASRTLVRTCNKPGFSWLPDHLRLPNKPPGSGFGLDWAVHSLGSFPSQPQPAHAKAFLDSIPYSTQDTALFNKLACFENVLKKLTYARAMQKVKWNVCGSCGANNVAVWNMMQENHVHPQRYDDK